MTRLRYTLAEAKEEATRRAIKFIAGRSDRDSFLYRGTYPDSFALRSQASKHPVAWTVVFAPRPKEGEIIDGGELIVDVNLESGSVAFSQF